MKKRVTVLGMLVLLMVVTGAASTTTRGWGDHAAPFSFLFGNHIDTHQETRLFTNGKNAGNLKGWLYVFDSGERLADGTPVLRHCTSPEHYAAGCVAGWRVEAVPCIEEVNGCRATFLYHDDDHPIWLFGARVDMQGNLRGSRTQLVQPGSYSHFHWLTENLEGFPSSLADVEAALGVDITVPAECNVATAEQLTAGVVCPGYFLQLTVDEPFGLSRWVFHHGGENLLVQHGVDTMTHLNLLTSYRSLPPGVLPGNYVEP